MPSLKLPNALTLLDAGCSAVEFAAAEADASDGKKKLRRYSMTAYTGVAVTLGGWPYPVVIDLAGLTSPQNIPNLMKHDIDRPVGHTESVEISPQRVKASGVVSGIEDDPDVRKLTGMASNGYQWQASIGVAPKSVVFLDRGESATVNGRRLEGPAHIVRRGVLREISFCSLGADGDTSAALGASKHAACTLEAISMGFEAWLKAKGFEDVAALSETQKVFLQAMFEQEGKTPPVNAGATPPAPPAAPPANPPADPIVAAVAAQRAALAADLQRVDGIRRICASHPGVTVQVNGAPVSLESHALAEGWDVTRTELEALRGSRPTGPAIHSHGPVDLSGEVVEAAVWRELRLQGTEKKFKPQTLEASDKLRKQGIGLQWMILQAARGRGWSGGAWKINSGNIKEVMLAAFNPWVQAASSTYSIPNILSNVANKQILDTFMAIEQTWRLIADVGRVTDFKRITRHRLTADAVYEEVAKDGELKHGTLGEESFGNQADTYGKIFTITRKDIINDDLGALQAVTKKLGRGAALKINDVFWREFLDNGTFFATGNNNYYAHATLSLLDETGMTKAQTLFRNQKDPNGDPLAIAPSLLLVPNELEVPAGKLMQSLTVDQTGGSTTVSYAPKNVFADKFTVAQSSYLANAKYTPNHSDKAWYLLANPLDVPVIEIVFLDGKDTPTVESAEADFGTLGIDFRGFHDFGVEKQAFRGGVKMKGAA